MKKLVLIILDGWGINPNKDANAIALAKTPNLDKLINKYPNTALNASGLAVGLPDGQMGNSEVGHLTIGAGRVICQDLSRIDNAVNTGKFAENRVLKDSILKAKKDGVALHLMGLISDGGVHSHIRHLYAILYIAKQNGLKEVYIHAIMDGRDTPPKSGLGYIKELQAFIEKNDIGKIATISGRFYAMDRDSRWQRVEKAYKAIVCGKGKMVEGPVKAMQIAYEAGETDEFIIPTVITRNGRPPDVVKDRDNVIFFNFRADRSRELTRAFTQEGFNFFNVKKRPILSLFICLTEYDKEFNLPVAFPPQSFKETISSIMGHKGISQFRIAETEKYAHVTFFFNGGIEKSFSGEEQLLIPSPKEVPTYDLKPEMSAYKVTDALIERIKMNRDNFILVNYANGDMVGHTGVIDAAIKACETVDECLGAVVQEAEKNGWSIIITADHGNAEQMLNTDTGEPHTAHTTNPVPFILIDKDLQAVSLRSGDLSDIAPTILEILEIDKPEEMSGTTLIVA